MTLKQKALGRDGLRAVPFFSWLIELEIISRTAQRPSLPLIDQRRRKWPFLASGAGVASTDPPNPKLRTTNVD